MNTILVVGHPYGERTVVEMEVEVFEAIEQLHFNSNSGCMIMFENGWPKTIEEGSVLEVIMKETDKLHRFINEKGINKEWKRTSWTEITKESAESFLLNNFFIQQLSLSLYYQIKTR